MKLFRRRILLKLVILSTGSSIEFFLGQVLRLEEIVSIYPALSPPTLTPVASNRVCNAFALLQKSLKAGCYLILPHPFDKLSNSTSTAAARFQTPVKNNGSNQEAQNLQACRAHDWPLERWHFDYFRRVQVVDTLEEAVDYILRKES
ncbi:hypothetical protein J5N97_004643 [Dioscorea zingiberensis]|uniref:Uncharacterized protein n=1 Tax=Dioscorea zingiberensis TaxID=325984 RepID=A0A9D5D894_9LILI|nr:hypothetical protein J5N97_004643 [Dioscorea zingiberensis]